VALIDMGDFVGGMLKYLRKHPIQRVTIAGGFAKMVKLAQGFIDLHSRAGAVDFRWLAEAVEALGANRAVIDGVAQANTAAEVLEIATAAGLPLAEHVAVSAQATAAKLVLGTEIRVDIAIFDRDGALLATRSA
jgi:cobalt-precorrin-5B (C1)-methyltransferase